MDIFQLGKGCKEDIPDPRDYKAEPLLGASPAVDWNSGLFLPRPPLWNQQTSDSCVGAAWSYYHWQLKPDRDFCRKSIFAYIAQYYGAYIRDGGVRLVKFGQELTSETPDPEVRTPQSMRDKTGLDENDALDDRVLDSFIVPNTIDDCAKAIRDYKGCVFGVTGTNEGWVDKVNPRPPASGENPWGHALYLYAYHLHNGLKCVVARSSWDENDHHIKENYFVSGSTFNPWTLIPKGPETMKLVNDGGTIFLVGDIGKIGFADPVALEKFTAIQSTIESGSTGNLPQKGVFETGFTLHN